MMIYWSASSIQTPFTPGCSLFINAQHHCHSALPHSRHIKADPYSKFSVCQSSFNQAILPTYNKISSHFVQTLDLILFGSLIIRRQAWKVGSHRCSLNTSRHLEIVVELSCNSDQVEEPPMSLSFPVVDPGLSTVLPILSHIGALPRSSPKAAQVDCSVASSIEKVEQRTKASIDKLKDILFKVKTRAPDVSSMEVGAQFFSPHKSSDPPLSNISTMGIFDGRPPLPSPRKQSNFDKDSNMFLGENSGSQLPEGHVQQDGPTITQTLVKFDKETQSTIVTITASVREPESENNVEDSSDQAIVLAAQALGKSATLLEDKAHASLQASRVNRVVDAEDPNRYRSAAEHERIVVLLESGKVVEAIQIKKGVYSGTPFRPIFIVKLEQPNGSIMEAILKPFMPGDAHSRWVSASPDWVAYQVGQMLGTDMVPPAVMRKDIKVGERFYSLATLIHLVRQVKTLTSLAPEEWGSESAAVIVSNAHILDALLGSCPRSRNMFMEGQSWVDQDKSQVMLLDHPVGPGLGKPHPMWSQRAQSGGIKCVSQAMLTRLRGLNRNTVIEALGKTMIDALGNWVTRAEVDLILDRRDHIVSYFDAMAQRGIRSLIIV